MTAPRAIPTKYAGHLFRSRLEARWAVFFDALKISWQYEPQGYLVGGLNAECYPDVPSAQSRQYLPDFYLPQTETWVEVKGNADQFDWQLLADAVDWGAGLPGTADSHLTTRGLLLLGPIPNVADRPPLHPILQHHKGGLVNVARFAGDETLLVTEGLECFDSTCGIGLGFEAERDVRELLPGEYHYGSDSPLTWRVLRAYRAARSARFEHGESGGML